MAVHPRDIAAPAAFGMAFAALWEGAVAAFDLKPYFLVPPSSIVAQFVDNVGLIWDAASVSGLNAELS